MKPVLRRSSSASSPLPEAVFNRDGTLFHRVQQTAEPCCVRTFLSGTLRIAPYRLGTTAFLFVDRAEIRGQSRDFVIGQTLGDRLHNLMGA